MVDTAVVVGTLVVAGGRRSSSTVVGGAALQAEGGEKRKPTNKQNKPTLPTGSSGSSEGGAPFIARPNESHPSIFKVELLKIQGLLNTHVKKTEREAKKGHSSQKALSFRHSQFFFC